MPRILKLQSCVRAGREPASVYLAYYFTTGKFVCCCWSFDVYVAEAGARNKNRERTGNKHAGSYVELKKASERRDSKPISEQMGMFYK